MATQAYEQWVKVGSPYRLATPIIELKNLARRYGITFLGDIGNLAHLTANYPEDHTPFSYDAYPLALTDYVVCAIDLKHERGLGEALLEDARAGRVPWLKYLNFAYKNYSIRRGWQPVDNQDAHLHISIKSDWTTRSIGNYDPLGDNMAGEGAAILAMLLDGKSPTGVETVDGGKPREFIYRQFYDLTEKITQLATNLRTLEEQLAAVADALSDIEQRQLPVGSVSPLNITLSGTATPTEVQP